MFGIGRRSKNKIMENRIVDPNEPARPFVEVMDYREDRVGNMCPIECASPGMPVKLEIATRLMAAIITGKVYASHPIEEDEISKDALRYSDALLKAYNNQ